MIHRCFESGGITDLFTSKTLFRNMKKIRSGYAFAIRFCFPEMIFT